MCRFLLVRARKSIRPQELLSSFAHMCQDSRAPDGDWQGDGWGAAWQVDGQWKESKSLAPIWEDTHTFSQIPSTRLLVAHARSAGFPDQKGIIEYNQPYLADSLCFVFNGMIRGVRLPMKLEGRIGAQKLFSYLKQALKTKDGSQALHQLDETVLAHSRQVVGMNIGLVKDENFYALCEYGDNAAYFGLNYLTTPDLTMICSERLPAYTWNTMQKSQVLAL